ncbi:sigma factor-like helix-turn-helix DNA-binding protein [Paraburkholderia sp. BR13439]|uniref:sigma factor-like helix-turn-helix DNA-binding protein n=2 Tax=unclassified Paraburkholderia TaxID=2615204 RepID=UPI0034CF6454
MARSTILSGGRMSNKRLSMRQIREVLRLRFVCERSQREIATTIGVSSATVWDYLDRARRAQLDFGKAKSMDDARQPEVRRTQGRLLRSGS